MLNGLMFGIFIFSLLGSIWTTGLSFKNLSEDGEPPDKKIVKTKWILYSICLISLLIYIFTI